MGKGGNPTYLSKEAEEKNTKSYDFEESQKSGIKKVRIIIFFWLIFF